MDITKWGMILIKGEEDTLPDRIPSVAEGKIYPTYSYTDIIPGIMAVRSLFYYTGTRLDIPYPLFVPEIMGGMDSTWEDEPKVPSLKFRVIFLDGVRDFMWNFEYQGKDSDGKPKSYGRYGQLSVREVQDQLRQP